MIARLAPILGITFIDILGFSMLIPLLPYFVKHFGASDIVVGFLFSSFAACQFVAGPFWGNVSDRIGRKAVLIVSQIGATIGWTMLAFAPTIAWVFIARVVEGVSGGNISVTQAYVADLVEPEKRGRAFAYIGATFSGGLVFGPAIGSVLYDLYGFSAPFLAAAALQVVTLVATILILPESRSKPPDGEHVATLGEIVTSLRNPNVAPVLWQKLVYSLGLYGWFATFVLIIGVQLGIGAGQTMRLFAFFGVVSVLFQVFGSGRATDSFGPRLTANLGFAVLICAYAIMPALHTIVALSLGMAIFAVGLALENAAIPALLTGATPANQRGTILGVGSSLDSLSGVVMPPISTGVLGAFGVPWTVAISASLTVVALALGLRTRAPRSVRVAQTDATTAE